MTREGKLLIIAELWDFDVAVSLRGTATRMLKVLILLCVQPF